MTFAIAGTSGKTGQVIADALLAGGKKVRVIVRDTAKGELWKKRGAEVAVADLTDAVALTQALKGVEGAYLLVPPGPSEHYRADQDRISHALADALRATPVPHVVLLSSIGAQHAGGNGPIAGLHVAEDLFKKVPATNFTFLRAAYFLENLGASLGAVKDAGVLPSFFPADLRFPFTNTVDIGKLATRLLLEPEGKNRIVELGTLRSHTEIATALSGILGKQVKVQEGPATAVASTLVGFGVPNDLAKLYEEMTVGIIANHVVFEGHRRTEDNEPLARVLQRLL